MRVIAAFLAFVVVQSVIFLCLISFTGIKQSVYDQSYNSFNTQVISRAKTLNESFNSARSGFVPVAKLIEREINLYFSNWRTEIGSKEEDTAAALEIAAEHLVDYLDNSKEVSGVFIFLENGTTERDCVYIRDNSFGGNIRNSDSKIYVRGPSKIAKDFKYQLYYLWQPKQDFTELTSNNSTAFYDMPIMAAKTTDMANNDLFYWSRPFTLSKNDPYMITLSMPLLDIEGEPYGICGFEVSSDLLKKMLPYTELSTLPSIYALSDDNLNENEDFRISSGPYADQLFIGDGFRELKVESDFLLSKVQNINTRLPVFLCIKDELSLYGKTSLFYEEHWYLYGLTDEASIENYPKTVMNSLVISQIIILSISIFYIIYITLRITKPIKYLSEVVRKIDPEDMIDLPKTNITEIDELTGALELFSAAAASSASRLNTIIDMVGVSMGGFEQRLEEDKVFITDSLAKLLGLPQNTRKLNNKTWSDILHKIQLGNNEEICSIEDPDSKKVTWLRMRTMKNGSNISGVIMDVSDEILKLRRVEYERDFDGLTNILNRRAFLRILSDGLNKGDYPAGVLIMIDLDNLKYVNDTYGHDIGDSYLMLMANALKDFETKGGIISRMAGDEFMVFLPCSTDQLTVKKHIIQSLDVCKRKSIPLPGGGTQRLRFSAGISWYPKDSDKIELLVKYADFAMYEIKHNIKGTVGEFDIERYNKDSFLHDKLEMFDLLIENEEIKYMFQPIVDADTGEVFAYEMLMRSESEGFRTPYEILSIAKAESKLYYIELIGFRKMFQLMSEYADLLEGKYIFFNTISTIFLKDEDFSELEEKYSHLFSKVVIELTESEELSVELLEIKDARLKPYGSKLAIDDYGSGYNGELILVKTNPDYVKIDMSLIRDIHVDENKQVLVHNLIDYCKQRSIKTIAEGVETFDELKKLKLMGVDYFQGFYLKRPSYEISDIPEQIKKQIVDMSL